MASIRLYMLINESYFSHCTLLADSPSSRLTYFPPSASLWSLLLIVILRFYFFNLNLICFLSQRTCFGFHCAVGLLKYVIALSYSQLEVLVCEVTQRRLQPKLPSCLIKVNGRIWLRLAYFIFEFLYTFLFFFFLRHCI